MTGPTLVVRATTAAAVTALVALVVLGGAVLLSADALTRPGLALLFAVPVVRNVVVLARGRGSDRVLAVVGIVLVLVVGASAFDRAPPLDPAPPALPTSTP